MVMPEEILSVEFLKNLDQPYVNRLADMAKLKECPQGTILFEEGRDSPFIYFVLSGTVGLSVEEPCGAAYEVYEAGAGEVLGWSPVLGRHAMTATARAKSLCRLAVLDAGQLLQLCHRDAEFGAAFLREIAVVLSSRLSGTRRRLARA